MPSGEPQATAGPPPVAGSLVTSRPKGRGAGVGGSGVLSGVLGLGGCGFAAFNGCGFGAGLDVGVFWGGRCSRGAENRFFLRSFVKESERQEGVRTKKIRSTPAPMCGSAKRTLVLTKTAIRSGKTTPRNAIPHTKAAYINRVGSGSQGWWECAKGRKERKR